MKVVGRYSSLNDGEDLKLLFDHDLTPDSVVFDVGGYDGNWPARLINYKGFVSNYFIFEPMPKFYGWLTNRFKDPKIHVFNYGLSGSNYKTEFRENVDRSGAFCNQGPFYPVELRDIADVIPTLSINKIDLFVSNCEGGEYSLLPRLVESGLISLIDNLMVQFHAVGPEHEEKRQAIIYALSSTHKQTLEWPFNWDVWKKR